MTKIALFPEFTRFGLGLKDDYDKICRQFLPYADFSFGNLAIWLNHFDDLEISLLNDNLITKYTNFFDNNSYTVSILGKTRVDETIDAVFGYLTAHGHPLLLTVIPHTTIAHIKHSERYKITPQRDNYNYILSTEGLANLTGSSYGKLRRQVSRFEREYENRYQVKEFDLSIVSDMKLLINGIHGWDRLYTANDEEKSESLVLNASLNFASDLDIKNLSLLIDGSIHATTFYRQLPQGDHVLANHTKASYAHRNAFNVMVHKLAQHLYSQGIMYINFEQDLGIPGLREHKQGLRPIHFLEHYSIEPAVSSE